MRHCFARLAKRATRLVPVALAALLPVSGGASGTDEKIYWANETESSIRVARLGDGSGASILGGATVGGAPCGVAIDVQGGPHGKLYWADFSGDSIRVRNLDGAGGVTTLITGEDGACGVAIDRVAGKIYWANLNGGQIRVSNVDGSSVQTLVSGEAGPIGVAIDTTARTIYWTNNVGGQIRTANLDGRYPGRPMSVAIGEHNPIGVALDVVAGKVYWANFGNGVDVAGSIRRANLNGSKAETLVDVATAGTPDGVAGPAGVAIDPPNHKLYWANAVGGTIWSANLSDGSGAQQLVGRDGPGAAFSSNFPVLLRAPAGSAPPTISGEMRVGTELTCSSGAWQPDLTGSFLFRAPHTITYQWQLDGTDIVGAKGSSFTSGKPASYTCRTTASNQVGSASQTSAPFVLRQQ